MITVLVIHISTLRVSVGYSDYFNDKDSIPTPLT